MTPITIPFPPSTNALWRSVGGRNILSAPYRKWLTEAHQLVALQRPAKVTGPYRMTVTATRPDNRRRDLSNTIKALEDLLVKAGVIRDDSDAQSILLMWSEGKPDKAAGVRVLVEAM